MRSLRAALLLTAAISSVVAAIFFVLPPSVGAPTERSAGGGAAFSHPTIPPSDPALAEDVVLANVFSERRTPPTSRYAPPDATTDASGGVVEMPAESSSTEQAPAGTPRLLGTVVGPQGTQALLQLDPYAGQPRLYSVGDRDAGFRVIAISPRSAVLIGPQGRVTVRLEQEEERP